MPSKISLIYDELLSRAGTALPDHKQLRDVEDLANNPDHVLRAALGIQPGAGENTNRCLDTQRYYLQRDFELVITREMVQLPEDVDTMHSKWKAILEDLNTLLKAITGQITIGAQAEVAFKCEYTGDQGPRTIQVGQLTYAFIELAITVEYHELTTGGI